MSWNKLFEALDEEFSEKRHVKHSNRATLTFLDEIAHELTEDQLEEREALKKAGKAIKSGWMKLKTKIKEVSKWGFRLGVAIGKTFNGKFVLFNTKGKILVPEALKISYQKLKSGPKKTLTLEYNMPQGKGRNMEIHVNDKLSFGFGEAFGGSGQGIMYVVEPNQPGLRENIDYSRSQIIAEGEKEDIEALSWTDELAFDSFDGPGQEILSNTEESQPKIAPVDVDYNDFKEELKSLMKRVKEGKVMKNSSIKTLAIYAPTGWGKSKIIEDVAKDMDYFFWPLELQKVDINILSGFPYLDDAKEVNDIDDAVKEDRLERAKKIVKLAPSQHLPPSKAPGNWLLFFDEFNRADTEKMSAVMNLLLTGELGGAAELIRGGDEDKKDLDRYKLPKKVVVVLAMNTGTQTGIEDAMNAVKDLDIATLERVHRVVFGKYHAPSWLYSFANKPTTVELESGEKLPVISRVPAIITSFIKTTMMDASGQGKDKAAAAPFTLPITVARKEDAEGGGGERTSSPRAWTLIADDMMERGYAWFNEIPKKEIEAKYKPRAEAIMKKVQKIIKSKNLDTKVSNNVDDWLFAAWLQDANNQVLLLAKQSPELGDQGPEIVGKMIRAFQKKAKEGISDESLLLNYPAVQSIVKNNYKNLGFGTHAKLLARLYNTLSKYDSEEEIKEFMDEKGWPIVSTKGIIEQIYLTIKKLYEDLDMSGSDFTTFAHLIDSGAKKNESGIIRSLHQKMAAVDQSGKNKWDAYVEALKSSVKTKSQVEKELKELGGKSSIDDKDHDEDSDEEQNEDLELFFRKIQGRI